MLQVGYRRHSRMTERRQVLHLQFRCDCVLQLECSIPWLNESLILFTAALRKCQQLKDKVPICLSISLCEGLSIVIILLHCRQ